MREVSWEILLQGGTSPGRWGSVQRISEVRNSSIYTLIIQHISP